MVFNRASLVVIFRIKINLLNYNQACEQALGVGGGGGDSAGRECCKKVSVIVPRGYPCKLSQGYLSLPIKG